jgi:hypothetical protein
LGDVIGFELFAKISPKTRISSRFSAWHNANLWKQRIDGAVIEGLLNEFDRRKSLAVGLITCFVSVRMRTSAEAF